MSRGALVRFLLVLGLLGGCLALTLSVKPNLGLDLRGGAQFVFQAEDTGSVQATATNVDKTVEVLRGRVDALGVAESTLVRQGEDRILVELPGVSSDEESKQAEERIGRTAQLSAHPVLKSLPAEPTKDQLAKAKERGNQILPSDQGDSLEVGPAVLAGADNHRRRRGAAAEQRRATRVARLQRQGRQRLGRRHRQGGLQPGGRPQAPGRHRAGQRDHHLARRSTRVWAATSASRAAAPRSPVTSP